MLVVSGRVTHLVVTVMGKGSIFVGMIGNPMNLALLPVFRQDPMQGVVGMGILERNKHKDHEFECFMTKVALNSDVFWFLKDA